MDTLNKINKNKTSFRELNEKKQQVIAACQVCYSVEEICTEAIHYWLWFVHITVHICQICFQQTATSLYLGENFSVTLYKFIQATAACFQDAIYVVKCLDRSSLCLYCSELYSQAYNGTNSQQSPWNIYIVENWMLIALVNYWLFWVRIIGRNGLFSQITFLSVFSSSIWHLPSASSEILPSLSSLFYVTTELFLCKFRILLISTKPNRPVLQSAKKQAVQVYKGKPW